jgi:hypothetical protein
MFNHSSRVLSAAAGVALALLLGCTDLRPVTPSTRVADRPAKDVVLSLPISCVTAPERTPMGRPGGDDEHEYTLPPGRYVPKFEDARGVYFESPSGVAVTQPLPIGKRSRPGGIYVPSGQELAASQYLGDEDRVTERYRLPNRCDYSFEQRPNPQSVN